MAKNVLHLLEGEALEAYESIDPPAIHLTLGTVRPYPDIPHGCKARLTIVEPGKTKNVVFRNPAAGSDEPIIMPRDDGSVLLTLCRFAFAEQM